jgi:hypothetical protein
MAQTPNIGNLTGTWTYRSFLNDPDVTTDFNALEFGRGNISVADAPLGVFKGRIFGPGWGLDLNGAIGYGNPWSVRFQGVGVVGGETWIYDYTGVVVPPWPNGIDQRPALVGSIVRTVPHASGAGGVAPAGVVCSWIAVWQSAASG